MNNMKKEVKDFPDGMRQVKLEFITDSKDWKQKIIINKKESSCGSRNTVGA